MYDERRKDVDERHFFKDEIRVKLENNGIFYTFGFLTADKMPKTKRLSPSWIIHIFAILHALTAVFLRWAGGEDELLLTVLTITMSLVICYRKNQKIEFTAAVIIVGNILGYLLGNYGAKIIAMVVSSPYLIYPLATALTTEVLGWTILLTIKVSSQENAKDSESRFSFSYMKWILLAVAMVMLIRICFIAFFSKGNFNTEHLLLITGKILTNSMGIIILVGLNVIFISHADKLSAKCPKCRKIAIFAAFMIAVSLIETFIIRAEITASGKSDVNHSFPLLFVVSLVAQTTIYCIVFIIHYALTSRSKMLAHKEEANLAQYRYLKLKRQVNPHFLFNSLNILDCLVCDEKNEEASLYIHKLAGIYRYMIKSEDYELVPLREEMEFVGQYIDLLKLRFPEGFDVIIDVPQEQMARFVLPCSIQLLIENATKHNAVSTDNPLVIKIKAEADKICVSNNLVPKITVSSSTGLGQKYISQQYQDLSGKSIDIRKTEDEYFVTLPLL